METIVDWCGSICALSYGVIFVTLGVPLALGKVPRNRAYGFRTRATLARDETWYPVNELAGKQMSALGAVFLLMSGASFLLLRERPLQLMALAATVVVLAAGMVTTLISGRRLTARIRDGR